MGSGHDTASFNRGVRASVAWLHREALTMNDPHARAVLNSAADHLGTSKPTGAFVGEPASRSEYRRMFGEIPTPEEIAQLRALLVEAVGVLGPFAEIAETETMQRLVLGPDIDHWELRYDQHALTLGNIRAARDLKAELLRVLEGES